MALRRLIARVRALSPLAADRLLGAVVTLVAVVEGATASWDGRSGGLAAVTGVLAALVLTERRRHPLPAVLLVSAILVGGDAAGGAIGTASVAAFVLSLYALGSHGSGATVPLGAGFAGLAFTADTVVDAYDTTPEDFLFLGVIVAAPVLAGRAVRGRRKLATALAERADRLEAEGEERARLAADEERARIARELHDVVAHALSGMVVQAGAARRLAPEDAEAAGAALGSAEDTGREALAEMRRLLGVLRREDDEPTLAPQPGLGQVTRLVEEARSAGLNVELRQDGEPAPLTPGADLMGYRVLRGGLARARRSYPGAIVRVRVTYGERELELEVAGRGDGPQGPTPEEEAELEGARGHLAVYGGELQAGRRRDGEIFLRARLPMEAVRA